MRLTVVFLALLLGVTLAGQAGAGASTPGTHLTDMDGVAVSVDRTSAVGEPQRVVTFEITLAAREGIQRRVTFELAHATEGFTVPVPAPVVLSAAEGGTAVVPLHVMMRYHNGYVDDKGTVVLRLTSAPTGNAGGETLTHDVTFQLHSRGTYVPGPGVALLVPVLAGLAAGTRRAAKGP